MAAVSPTKFAPLDWHASNYKISSSADKQRQISHDIRQLSHTTRNVTESNTQWTQHGTDSDLVQRIGDIDDWKKTLITTLQNVETEITKLSEHKQLAEKALEAKNIPLAVVLECLSYREQRVSIDLVRDEVETELQKELDVIGGIQNALLLKINAAFQQLCILQECHEKLCADLSDKDSAQGIDSMCKDLTNKAATLSMQPDPTRIMKGIVTPQQWGSFSAHNTATSVTEMRNSERLRESIHQTIRQTTADLEAQWTATHYAFRKRKHEMEQTKRELEWQKKSTEKEISDVNGEIQDLEEALVEKTPPMMVAHTRLESRTYRPNVELCRDKPQYGMVEEIATITESMQALQDKLGMANETLGILERTLERINDDLMVKSNSLDLDEQCTQVRQKLSQHPKLL